MKIGVAIAVLSLAAASVAFAALGDVVNSFPIPGDYQKGLAISGEYLYVYSQMDVRIYRVNPTSGLVYDYVPPPTGSFMSGLAYASGGYLYQNQSDRQPFALYRLNASTGSIYGSFSLPNNRCDGSAPLATGDGGAGTTRIIVCAFGEPSTIYFFTLSGGITGSFMAAPYMFDIAYDWRNRLIWGGMHSNYIYGFTTGGSFVTSVSTPAWTVFGMTYYDSYLWVGEAWGNIHQIHCPANVGVGPASIGKIKAIYR